LIIEAWNIVSGCERLSPGCDNCPTYWEYKEKGLDYHPQEHLERLPIPTDNQTPSMYMVAAGSDLFHEAVTADFIKDAFKVMRTAYWHQFQIVTKRAERLEAFSREYLYWPANALAGVSVEEERYKWRIDCLRNVKASRFVSFGPMTGAMGTLNLSDIHQAGVVVEHWGPNPRDVLPEWVDEIHKQCEEQGVKILNKHWLSQETA
tara:strand:- start:473 stop:1087 length:615 start_codon:yes stop_codon:yes gene_type:complete